MSDRVLPGRRAALRRSGGILGARAVAGFIVTRISWGVVTLLVLSVVIFAATHLLVGDPAGAILGARATPERVALLNRELGLDRPLVNQYLDWFWGAMRGDLGNSVAGVAGGNTGANASVASMLGPRARNSLSLLVLSSLICVPMAIGLGTWAAIRRSSRVASVLTPAIVFLSAIPEFILGVILVVIFATGLFHWFPAVSTLSATGVPWDNWEAFALPALTLSLSGTPYIYRMTRAMMLEVLDSEYVVAARLRGVPGPRMLFRHALPNALAPTIQTLALTATYLVGGAVVVEGVFNFPGIGTALVDAVGNRDFPVIQAVCLGLALLYIAVFLVADVVAGLLSPKGDLR